MALDDLTIGEARQLAAMFGTSGAPAGEVAPFEIGENYLIRTVTMIDTGRVVAVTPQFVVLEDAAWIADTGRFADALSSATFSEVEPFPDGQVFVAIGAIVDACRIRSLPRDQK